MKKNRDDFYKPVKDLLGKRVGFHCSNPKCRKLTIGSNESKGKFTSIGIAAHITAASVGGPRYNPALTQEERISFENGIWLCSNCATLIDKDPNHYSEATLNEWKKNAENETIEKLNGVFSSGVPYLEIDLIRTRKARIHKGYSYNNPVIIENDTPVIDVRDKPNIRWELQWKFKLNIVNNSEFPAYNLSLKSVGSVHFSRIESLPKINNIPPFHSITLLASYQFLVESNYEIADQILNITIPEKFNKMILKLDFSDRDRRQYSNYVEFLNGAVISRAW